MFIQLEEAGLRPYMKEEILDELIRIDKVLEDMDYIQHDLELTSIGADSSIERSIEMIEVENIYREHVLKILPQFGIIMTDESPPTHLLAELMDLLSDIGEVTNKEFISGIVEQYEEPLLIFYNLVEEFTGIRSIELFPFVDDFDDASILEIRNHFPSELEDDELEEIRKYADRGRTLLKNFPSNEIDITRNFIKAREARFAFGFSFKVATMAIRDKLEYYITTADYSRVRSELIALALASSLDDSIITESVMDFLEAMDIDIRKAMSISGPIPDMVDKLMRSYNEDHN